MYPSPIRIIYPLLSFGGLVKKREIYVVSITGGLTIASTCWVFCQLPESVHQLKERQLDIYILDARRLFRKRSSDTRMVIIKLETTKNTKTSPPPNKRNLTKKEREFLNKMCWIVMNCRHCFKKQHPSFIINIHTFCILFLV